MFCFFSCRDFETAQIKTYGLKIQNCDVTFFLYGCETWTRLRVFENRELRRIFGHKKEEVTEGWRKFA
jgi:hypothetical protein